MTDQQRWDAMSASGDWVKTPALDRIAAEGVCFTQCVTTTPICMPARLTLATGRYPHNNAVWTNGRYTMPANADNWMREIKKLGYRTSLFGKTHLYPYGRTDLRDKEDLLHAYGLDDVNEVGGPHASTAGMSHLVAIWKEKGLLKACQDDFKERRDKPWVARPSVLPLEYYADVYVGQQAKQYLADYNRDEPWFCWVSFGGPHEPWDAPEPYASMYDPARMPAPATDDEEEVPRPRGQIDRMRENKRTCPDFDAGDVGAMRANYAGNVSLIDDQIGEILAVIEERGEMDDTVIAFTSDHGEMNGDHGLIYKMNFYDGALRVPLIVRTPGPDNSGVVNDSLAENSDLGPTLVELAGGSIEYQQFARSLTGALDGSAHREDVLSEFVGEFMLMTDEWKIAVNPEGQIYMLFDRQNDPGETRNLAGLPDYQCDADALRLRLLERVVQSQLSEPDAY